MVLAIGEDTATQAVVGSIVLVFRRLKNQGVGIWGPAASRFMAYAPTLQFSIYAGGPFATAHSQTAITGRDPLQRVAPHAGRGTVGALDLCR